MRIEDYALIGDCHTAALVGRNGSIDWLCWPRFDSAACFAALLGEPEHGFWRISPTGPALAAGRRYRPDTLILETEFETAGGAVTLIDFMPVHNARSDLVRVVVGRRGRVAMESEGVLRFDYGASVPWVTLDADRTCLHAVAGPDLATLCAPVALDLLARVPRVPVEAVEARAEVERAHEVLEQERLKAARVGRRDAEELVELEEMRTSEVELSAARAQHELRVEGDGRRPGGQEEHGLGPRAQGVGHQIGGPPRDGERVGVAFELHPLWWRIRGTEEHSRFSPALVEGKRLRSPRRAREG